MAHPRSAGDQHLRDGLRGSRRTSGANRTTCIPKNCRHDLGGRQRFAVDRRQPSRHEKFFGPLVSRPIPSCSLEFCAHEPGLIENCTRTGQSESVDCRKNFTQVNRRHVFSLVSSVLDLPADAAARHFDLSAREHAQKSAAALLVNFRNHVLLTFAPPNRAQSERFRSLLDRAAALRDVARYLPSRLQVICGSGCDRYGRRYSAFGRPLGCFGFLGKLRCVRVAHIDNIRPESKNVKAFSSEDQPHGLNYATSHSRAG